MQFLAVKNHEKLQHYKDRSPPWIKLYKSLLEDLTFLALPEAAQAQLVKLWIVASTCYNRIPHDSRMIGQLIHVRGRLYVAELLDAGFLYVASNPASETDSKVASNGASNLSPAPRALAREEERERELEKEKPSSSARAKTGRVMLLEQIQPSQREAMGRTLDTFAQGYDIGAGYGVPTIAQVDQACREVLASVPAHSISAKVVRGFLRNVIKPPTKPEPSVSGRKRGGAAGWDDVT